MAASEELAGGAVSQDEAVVVFAMGCNADGQLGTGMSEDGEDQVWEPTLVQSLSRLAVVAIAAARRHSVWLTKDGVVYTAGDNDEGQLGRTGKRTKPMKVDAIEHLPIEAVSAGEGFTNMAARLDGRLLGVGRGERGQLGMGGADREQKERVKFSSALGEEQLLALVAGEAHCVALSRSGKVLAFGENKYGQLGFGDFVSSATPKPVPTLMCRPVVSLCCGAAHTLARTATGLLWAWGCNENGQLGLGDLRPRYRPEKVNFGVSRCAHVAAGFRHTLALSERGLLFAFGAGGCGQLGSGGIADAEPTPRPVAALREVGPCLKAACGHSHSVALMWNEDGEKESLYSWGLGSSGQLGVPRDRLQDRKFALLPIRVRLDPSFRVADIYSGALAHHTFVLAEPATASGGASSPSGASRVSAGPAARSSLRTAIDADELLDTLRRLATTGQGGEAISTQLKALTKAVGAAFSSASVLNASFGTSGRLAAASEEHSGVDLLKVRRAYNTLVFELKSHEVIEILGRATLHICGELAKQKVPTDDPENLRVFLVLFENPLLLSEHRTALFPGFHLALQKLIAAVRLLPKDSQRLLFGWFKRLPSEYFGRVVDVVQQFVSFVLTQPGQNQSDASAAVLMLGTLWELNREMDGILPEWCFHNGAISRSSDAVLQEHCRQWSSGQGRVFSYCNYPFLLDADAKRRLLSFDAALQRDIAMQELVAETLRQGLPVEATLGRILLMRVRREHILSDFCGQLWWRLSKNPQCLRLPLSVEFVGELGVDAGGLRKECLQLVLRQLYERTTLFVELEEWPGLFWFRPTSNFFGKGSVVVDATFDFAMFSSDWPEHLPQIAGAIVGLAVFNSIYLDLRLHPLIYRFLVARAVDVTFDDLRAVHPTLHRSLESLKAASDVRSLGLSWRVRLPGADAETDLLGRGDGEAAIETPEDARLFSNLYAEAATVGEARPQLEAFVRAAADRMALGSAYTLCTAHDLELLVCGSPDIGDFRELEHSCKYTNGFSPHSITVRLFWEVVHGMSEVMKRKLLLFCTGCDRVPILGIKALGFVVARSAASVDHLPTASICINQLNLPEYESLQVVRDRVYAALEHHTGFGFA